jgi:hypothetical protein
MKKIVITLVGLILIIGAITNAELKDLEIKGKQLISQEPPFTIELHSELRLVHSFFHENPKESSLTRVYFLIKERNRQIEEMLILQIGDRTNPQAGPITAPPLTPYTEKKMFLRDKGKRGELEVDYLIQVMAWNPDAPSLQPIRKKGVNLPSHWVLQGQFLIIYQGEHAIYIRYSRDINTFGLKASEEGKAWEKGSISGNEKRVVEIFQRTFLSMMDSVQFRNP